MSTAASCSERSQKGAHHPGVSTSVSDVWRSSVSALLCRLTCYGFHRGGIPRTRLLEAVPLQPGAGPSRRGQNKRRLFSSNQQPWPASCGSYANPCPSQPLRSWELASVQNSRPQQRAPPTIGGGSYLLMPAILKRIRVLLEVDQALFGMSYLRTSYLARPRVICKRSLRSKSSSLSVTLPVSGGWHNEDCRVSLSVTVRYLRSSFHTGVLSAGQVGNLIAALRRYITLVKSLGGDLPDTKSHFGILWKLHRSWLMAIPQDFRAPVPLNVALAIAVASWLAGWHELALLTLVSFHCLLRPAEARNLRWEDLHCFDEQQRARYPGLFGLIGVALPKTRRLAAHAWHQHVLVECPGLGRLLRAALVHLAPNDRSQTIWNRQPSQHLTQFYGNPATAWCTFAAHRSTSRCTGFEAEALQNTGCSSGILPLSDAAAAGPQSAPWSAMYRKEHSACTRCDCPRTPQEESMNSPGWHQVSLQKCSPTRPTAIPICHRLRQGVVGGDTAVQPPSNLLH